MGKGARQRRAWAELKAAHRNTRVTVRVPFDADAADEAERLAAQLPQVRDDDDRENRIPEAPKLAARIQELEAAARGSEVEFTFEGIGRRRYQQLLDENPATKEQNEAAGEQLAYNIERFPPLLLAASCVEPVELAGNLAEWTEIHDEWSAGQVGRLWRACTQANAAVSEPPKSLLASSILATNASERS